MAYQPPLIGFKQLLNFGAYSVPAIGGWLFIISGILMLISTVIESERFKKMNLFKTKGTALLSILMVFLISCTSNSPDPTKLNQESCEYCKMRITNGHLGAELQTKKGRVYKFDDLSCMIKYIKANSGTEVGNIYVNDYEANNLIS